MSERDDGPHFEVMSAGEMRRKYGLTAENRPIIRLDPEKVPVGLRHLILLAEHFGVSDDLIRDDVVRKTPPDLVAEMRRVVEENFRLFDEWLAGPAADEPTCSDEYIAFTCLRMAADGC